MKNKTISTNFHKNYCQHWATWQAIRELLANAIDGGLLDYSEEFDSNYCFTVTNSEILTDDAFIIGKSTKTSENIGQFGEGLKVALLVLLRAGASISIISGTQTYSPFFDDNEILCLDVTPNGCKLAFTEIKVTLPPGTAPKYVVSHYYVPNLGTTSQYFSRDAEFAKFRETVKVEEHEAHPADRFYRNALFVAGLYITQLNESSYFFNQCFNADPASVQLSRDRDSIISGTLGRCDLATFACNFIISDKLRTTGLCDVEPAHLGTLLRQTLGCSSFLSGGVLSGLKSKQYYDDEKQTLYTRTLVTLFDYAFNCDLWVFFTNTDGVSKTKDNWVYLANFNKEVISDVIARVDYDCYLLTEKSQSLAETFAEARKFSEVLYQTLTNPENLCVRPDIDKLLVDEKLNLHAIDRISTFEHLLSKIPCFSRLIQKQMSQPEGN